MMRNAALLLIVACGVLLVVREYCEWKQRAIYVQKEVQAVVKKADTLLDSGKELIESWKRRRLFGESE
jgi:hypothetical protein